MVNRTIPIPIKLDKIPMKHTTDDITLKMPPW